MLIRGKSYFTRTTKPATKGKYGVGKYSVGVRDFEVVSNDDSNFDITPFIKEVTDKESGEDFEVVSIQNSEFPPKMYDMNNNKMEQNISVPKDHDITISVVKRHSDEFDVDYLVCNGVKINEEIEEYNPFA